MQVSKFDKKNLKIMFTQGRIFLKFSEAVLANPEGNEMDAIAVMEYMFTLAW